MTISDNYDSTTSPTEISQSNHDHLSATREYKANKTAQDDVDEKNDHDSKEKSSSWLIHNVMLLVLILLFMTHCVVVLLWKNSLEQRIVDLKQILEKTRKTSTMTTTTMTTSTENDSLTLSTNPLNRRLSNNTTSSSSGGLSDFFDNYNSKGSPQLVSPLQQFRMNLKRKQLGI